MTRTVSARIPKEWHEDLRERCNQTGCTINDFLCGAIELALTGHTEQDFGDEELEEETKSSVKETKNHEGKKPTLHFHVENEMLVQDETTWS